MRNRSNQPGPGTRPGAAAGVTGHAATSAPPASSPLAEWPVRLGLLVVTLLTVWALFGDDLAQILGRSPPPGAPGPASSPGTAPKAVTPEPGAAPQ